MLHCLERPSPCAAGWLAGVASRRQPSTIHYRWGRKVAIVSAARKQGCTCAARACEAAAGGGPPAAAPPPAGLLAPRPSPSSPCPRAGERVRTAALASPPPPPPPAPLALAGRGARPPPRPMPPLALGGRGPRPIPRPAPRPTLSPAAGRMRMPLCPVPSLWCQIESLRQDLWEGLRQAVLAEEAVHCR